MRDEGGRMKDEEEKAKGVEGYTCWLENGNGVIG
jgi:hypothetical protein